MDSAFITSMDLASQEITIYFGIPISVLGVIGACLNIIVFLSLKTFRQSSCAFYLLVMSTFDLGRIFFNAVTFIARWGFNTDWGAASLFFCKIRYGTYTVSTLSSMTCLCLAIIDQYFATSSHIRWQQWCNIKLAHRLTSIFIIIWILQGIPCLIFNNQIILSSTNTITCVVTNDIFNQYLTYGFYITLLNLIPLITIVFGLMAYYNARNLTRRAVPLFRRELDKQLTIMVLIQVLISFCTSVPYSTQIIYSIMNTAQTDPVILAKRNLVAKIITNYFILSFTSPFYTYVCVSQRFRRQLKYVLFGICVKRFRTNKIAPNQIAPNQIAVDITTNI